MALAPKKRLIRSHLGPIMPFIRQFWLPSAISLITFFITEGLKLGLANQIALSFLGFLLPVFVNIQLALDAIQNQHDRQRENAVRHLRGSKNLESILNAFNSLANSAHSDGGLFLRFFERKLLEFCQHINEAASTDQLRININHQYMTDTVLSVFDDPQIKDFKETYYIDDQQHIFDPHSLNYFVKIVGLAREGVVADVKSLFILPKTEVVAGSTFETLIEFHRAERAFSYRIISSKLYEEICTDVNIQADFLDFGLYGPGLMFRTVTYEPTTGCFARDRDQIAAFHELFDACWTSPGAVQISGKKQFTAQQALSRLIALSGAPSDSAPAAPDRGRPLNEA